MSEIHLYTTFEIDTMKMLILKSESPKNNDNLDTGYYIVADIFFKYVYTLLHN